MGLRLCNLVQEGSGGKHPETREGSSPVEINKRLATSPSADHYPDHEMGHGEHCSVHRTP